MSNIIKLNYVKFLYFPFILKQRITTANYYNNHSLDKLINYHSEYISYFTVPFALINYFWKHNKISDKYKIASLYHLKAVC